MFKTFERELGNLYPHRSDLHQLQTWLRTCHEFALHINCIIYFLFFHSAFVLCCHSWEFGNESFIEKALKEPTGDEENGAGILEVASSHKLTKTVYMKTLTGCSLAQLTYTSEPAPTEEDGSSNIIPTVYKDC